MQKFELNTYLLKRNLLEQVVYLVQTDLVIVLSLYLLPSLVSAALILSNPILGIMLYLLTTAVAVLLIAVKLLGMKADLSTSTTTSLREQVKSMEEKEVVVDNEDWATKTTIETRKGYETPKVHAKHNPDPDYIAVIEVKASKPTVTPLNYCDFEVDPDSFTSEDQAIEFIEKKLAERYSAIREFNPDVEEITWNVKGDTELHKVSLLLLKERSKK